ncbi:hypothetical protein GF312_14865 [Candidatus Poribacteria bacterium]|nr:hypothetical protein [Candidatus Poribacteria bacterium]
MIELPEVLTIAKQMNKEIKGKTIKSGNRGNSQHKWAFYNRDAEEFERILPGKTVGEISGNAGWIITNLEPGYALLLGDMGGKILFHQNDETIPDKYHLMLHFEDNTYLTVSIQGWGFIKIVEKSEVATDRHATQKILSPISHDFTFDYFHQLIKSYEKREKKSIKAFMITGPKKMPGIGNGYLQDILFRAKIHPKRVVAEISDDEIKGLYEAIKTTMKEAIELGGKDEEKDLYNNKGGYSRILNSKTKGKPCQECGTIIEKIQYMGGSSYFCPSCQA